MSKFINDETIAYLQAKDKSTVNDQLHNIRQRIDLEGDQLDKSIQQLNNKVEYLGKAIEMIQTNTEAQGTGLTAVKKALWEAQDRAKQLQNRLNAAVIIGTVIVIGVAVCLVKLLT